MIRFATRCVAAVALFACGVVFALVCHDGVPVVALILAAAAVWPERRA